MRRGTTERRFGGAHAAVLLHGRRALFLLLLVSASACAASRPQAVTSGQAPSTVALLADGGAAERAGDLTRAEQYYAAARARGVETREVTQALIGVCVRAGRFRSALQYGRAYLTQHPRDAVLRQLVGAIHLALGELDAAAEELALVVREHSDAAEAHYALAVVESRRAGREHRAHAHFERYLALSPEGRHAEEAEHAVRERGAE